MPRSCRPLAPACGESPQADERCHRLLLAFEWLSGSSILLNTLFKIQESVVCPPQQATRTFTRRSMDCLTIEKHLLERAVA